MSQEDLEAYDKVQPGKYTLGLGQRNMAFTGDQEDVVSMSLTAVQSLLDKYRINPCDIGRCTTLSFIPDSRILGSCLHGAFLVSALLCWGSLPHLSFLGSPGCPTLHEECGHMQPFIRTVWASLTEVDRVMIELIGQRGGADWRWEQRVLWTAASPSRLF